MLLPHNISSLPKGIHSGLSYLQGKCFLSSGFQRFLFKLLWFVRVHFLFIEKKEPRQIWELQWRKYHLNIGTSFQSSPCNAQNFQYSLELRFNLSSGNTLLLYPLFFSCSANQSCLSYSVYSSLPPRAQYTGAYVDTPISILFNITRLSIHHYAWLRNGKWTTGWRGPSRGRSGILQRKPFQTFPPERHFNTICKTHRVTLLINNFPLHCSKMIRLTSHSLNKLRIWPQILLLLSSINLENYQLEFLKNEKPCCKSVRAEKKVFWKVLRTILRLLLGGQQKILCPNTSIFDWKRYFKERTETLTEFHRQQLLCLYQWSFRAVRAPSSSVTCSHLRNGWAVHARPALTLCFWDELAAEVCARKISNLVESFCALAQQLYLSVSKFRPWSLCQSYAVGMPVLCHRTHLDADCWCVLLAWIWTWPVTPDLSSSL